MNKQVLALEALLIIFPLILVSGAGWFLHLSLVLTSPPELLNQQILALAFNTVGVVGVIFLGFEVSAHVDDRVCTMDNPIIGFLIHLAAFISVLSIAVRVVPNIFPNLIQFSLSTFTIGVPALIPYVHLMLSKYLANATDD